MGEAALPRGKFKIGVKEHEEKVPIHIDGAVPGAVAAAHRGIRGGGGCCPGRRYNVCHAKRGD